MADEYIKREDAIAKPFRFYWRNGVLSNPVVSVRDIKSLPAADVAPVVRGKWVIPTVIDGREFNIPHCSGCGGVPCGVNEHTHYCPNCGAKMDGGEDDAAD